MRVCRSNGASNHPGRPLTKRQIRNYDAETTLELLGSVSETMKMGARKHSVTFSAVSLCRTYADAGQLCSAMLKSREPIRDRAERLGSLAHQA